MRRVSVAARLAKAGGFGAATGERPAGAPEALGGPAAGQESTAPAFPAPDIAPETPLPSEELTDEPPEEVEPPPDDGAEDDVGDALALVEPADAPLGRPASVDDDPAMPARVYLAGLTTAKSRKTAVEAFRRAARVLLPDGSSEWELLPWARIGHRELLMVQTVLLRHLKPDSVALTMRLLRGPVRAAWRLGLIDAETLARAVDLPRVAGCGGPKKGRALAGDELAKLGEYIRDLPSPYREQVLAVFAAALGGGLRREELARLRVDSLSDDRKHLRVLGKGTKERLQPIGEEMRLALGGWLDVRESVRPLTTPSLFVCFSIHGIVQDKGYSPDSIYELVHRTLVAAGITNASTHDLRRTFATNRLEDGTDLGLLQKLMGHAAVSTTMLYDKRGDKPLAAAVEKASLFGKKD